MQPDKLTKRQLKREIYRFFKDKNRGISLDLFAELCGMSKFHLEEVFVNQTEPLTERTQIRVNKAYAAWKNGEVAIMQNRDRTKFVQYRKEAKPYFAPSMGLQVVNGAIQLKIGMKNQSDYSDLTLDEQLGGSNARSA